ncbi:MAG: hydrolase 1, exosortase A system-associated [Pseudomonadota bacterium]
MSSTDTALQFQCGQAAMIGILSLPAAAATRGVLIVVGGPQYRAGSHRQFTLLARELAAAGTAAMRFDYRGMGDSEGDVRSFDDVEDDLSAAVDAFFNAVPTLQSVVLWGLCDGACAALFYAPGDVRISGLVLLNPWMHTDAGAARTRLRHYYLERLMDRAFWHKLFSGQFDLIAAVRSLGQTLSQTWTKAHVTTPGPLAQVPIPVSSISVPTVSADAAISGELLPERMRQGFRDFQGKILLITSGRDLTAKQFLDAVANSREWRKLIRLPHVTRHNLAEADHTFSRRQWRDQVAAWTVQWAASIKPENLPKN